MNITELKMKDILEIEEISGLEMSQWEDAPSAKLTLAIAFVIAKKTQPTLKWEEILEWDLSQITKLVGEEVDPKGVNS